MPARGDADPEGHAPGTAILWGRLTNSLQSDGSGRGQRLLALAVALAYLVPALFCLGDYGPTYDAVKGDYPYGERVLGYLETGDERFLDLMLHEPTPRVREPHPDFDQQRWPSYWVFPVGALLSAVSCRVFWTELGWVPSMSAHHLPFVLVAALLVFIVTSFARARFGRLAGVVAGGSLFLVPAFFGHSFNNPKDITECLFYTGAVLLGLRAIEGGGARAWALAGAATGLALAQKANALFLPVQLVLFVAGLALYARLRGERGPRLEVRALFIAALSFVGVYYAVSPAFWSAPIEGPQQWLAQMIRVGSRAAREHGGVPAEISLDAPRAVLQTVPLVTLALALLGLARPGIPFALRWFLALSLCLPIGRNLLPGMRSFDGVRHFFEFLPMLCLLAGAGAAWLVERAQGRAWAVALVAGLALGPPAWAVVSTHPNQVAYFNALAGGLGTQQKRANPDASDYWGNSYWQGMRWLSAHAEPDAKLVVLFKDFIARAGAPLVLRADIRIRDVLPTGPEDLPLWVMHLVNKGGGEFERVLDAQHAPAHAIPVQNGVVLHLHHLQADELGQRLMRRWQAEFETRALRGDVLRFLGQDKALKAQVLGVLRERLTPEESLARLRPLVPPEVLAQFEELLSGDSDAEDGI